MSKQEFLDRLRMSLSSQLATGQVSEHLRFYEDYINTEIRKGHPEAAVLQTLGDPRLIARTIVDAAQADTGGSQSNEYHNQNYGYYQYRNVNYDGNSSDGRKQKSTGTSIMKWVWIILGILIVFGIISAVFSLVSFLLPFLVPVLIVVFITKLFRDWLN